MTKAKELGITKFPYLEHDDQGRITYREDKDGYWQKFTYGESNKLIFQENSLGEWCHFNEKTGKTLYNL